MGAPRDDAIVTKSQPPTIVVGVDYSELGRLALNAATGLAVDLGASLVLVHAFPRQLHVTPAAGDDAVALLAKYQAELEEEQAVALSTEWAQHARDAGVEVTTVARDGPPAEAIVEEADARDAAMIVVGTHGRSGLSKFIMGSVAERVIQRSDRPVLVVPVLGKK